VEAAREVKVRKHGGPTAHDARCTEKRRAGAGFGVMPDEGNTKALGTAARGRRRLSGETLIERRLGLSDKGPVRRRLERLLPGGSDRGGRAGSPIWARICSTDAASVMKAMMRMSARRSGQTSGSDANSRASSIAPRSDAGEPDVGSSALADKVFAGTCGPGASSRP
jgi:hypothetical protein